MCFLFNIFMNIVKIVIFRLISPYLSQKLDVIGNF